MNKYFLIIIICCFAGSLSVFSQRQKVQNQPYGDQRLYHFGVNVGLNFQDLILTNSGFTGENGETWFCEIPNYKPGFSVGLLADYYINPFMNLRFTPTLHFGDLSFKFIEENSKMTSTATIRSNNLMFPLEMKFSSLRTNNYRPYLLTGGYATLNLGRKKNEAILLKSLDYGLSIGVGCDFYLPIIKVCPEIRFCFGLTDLVEKDRSDLQDESLIKYSKSISKGASRMIVLTINFE